MWRRHWTEAQKIENGFKVIFFVKIFFIFNPCSISAVSSQTEPKSVLLCVTNQRNSSGSAFIIFTWFSIILTWAEVYFYIQYEQCCFIKRLLQDELLTKERLGVWSWVLLNVDNFCSQEMWSDFNLLSTVWVSSSKSKTCCLIKPVVLISWNEHKNIWWI